MNESIHLELKKLQDELGNLKTAIDHIEEVKNASKDAVKSAIQVSEITEKVSKDYSNLADKSESLIKKIESVNFPSRLSEIGENIKTSHQSIIDLMSKMENSERSIENRIDLVTDKILGKYNSGTKKLLEILEKSHNLHKQEFRRIRIWGFVFLSATIVTLLIILLLII